MEQITLLRHKNTPFTVNYENKRYVWAGSKGTIIGKKDVPMDVYDYLVALTSTFEDGELVLKPNTPQAIELEENVLDKEAYQSNSLPKEEIISLLTGNYKKMEAELNKITSESTKRFVLSIAKEIKISNATKQKFIKDWTGNTLSIEDIFDGE